MSQARLQHHTPLQRYASLEEAATYLGCDARTIRRAIGAGKLKGYRFGNKTIRVDLNDIDTLLKPIPTANEGGWKG